MNTSISIAIFASGSGTNMQAISDFFMAQPTLGVRVALVLSDNSEAYVLERARQMNIPAVVTTREQRQDSDFMESILAKYQIKYIILAGYLKRVPSFLVKAYSGKILNIHPALLPLHGGKGMYGMHVHEAVKKSGETETGITIHEIDEVYDMGKTIFQAQIAIDPHNDTPEDIAHKVHLLEYRHFPEQISNWILKKERSH